jgi:hypothetical protein
MKNSEIELLQSLRTFIPEADSKVPGDCWSSYMGLPEALLYLHMLVIKVFIGCHGLFLCI